MPGPVLGYRLLITLAAPVLLAGLVLRVLRGRETTADLGERLGLGKVARADLWLHGASNGELTSARPLIDALTRLRPGLRILVTANTVTGREMARAWALPGLSVRLAPIDLRLCLGRVIGGAAPALFLGVESELWPNRLTGLARRGIPVALVGARLSDRSARRWPKGLAAQVLSAVTHLSPQDEASANRFRALGVPGAAIGPILNLKALVAGAPADADAPAFDRAATICAAATHPGEEEVVLAAFAEACATRPALRLILAPRHPRRADEVERLGAAAGLGLARRTRGEAPGADRPVYLADTMGEMALWHAAASVTFVGGSLVEKGGHTPYEPARAGSAILHGPHVANFAGPYAALDRADAARVVTGAADLARAFHDLPGSAEAEAMAARATAALAHGQDAAALDALAAHLLALMDGARDASAGPPPRL